MRACAEAVRVDTSQVAGHLCVGDLHLQTDDAEAALLAYRQALAADPAALEASRQFGRVALRLRRFGEAAAALARVIELGDESEQALGDLGRARHWEAAGPDLARPYLQRAVEQGHAALRSSPDATALHLRLAEYHALLAQEDQARRHLHHAVTAAPDQPDVLFRAAVVYSEMEQREEALSWLQRATRGGASLSLLRDAVELDGLRDEPRFAALVN
jgi:serine/threonine-protein kinase